MCCVYTLSIFDMAYCKNANTVLHKQSNRPEVQAMTQLNHWPQRSVEGQGRGSKLTTGHSCPSLEAETEPWQREMWQEWTQYIYIHRS